MSENYPAFSARTEEPKSFGHGWLSGVFALLLGMTGLFAVLCMLWPSLLTIEQLRGFYQPDLPVIRVLIHFALFSAFVLVFLSIVLRQNKIFDVIAILCVLAAAALGGSQAPIHGNLASPAYLGLDGAQMAYPCLPERPASDTEPP